MIMSPSGRHMLPMKEQKPDAMGTEAAPAEGERERSGTREAWLGSHEAGFCAASRGW